MAEHTRRQAGRPPGSPAGPALSPRELDVLESLARGESNRAIALRLGIAERTVKTHLTELYNKLGVDTRGEAVLAARQRGWLAADRGPQI